MTEREYRDIKKDSYTTLKEFDTDRKKYYKKYINTFTDEEEDEEDENRATIIGSIVDCNLLCPNEFDNKFYLSTCGSIPTGLMFKFVEALYRRTIDCCNSEGELTKQFASIAQDSYNDVKYDREGNTVAFKKQSFEKTIEIFSEGDGKIYYDEIRKVRPNKLVVITMEDIRRAEEICDNLKKNFVTRHLFKEQDEETDVFDQLIIEYKYRGMEFKSMIDKTLVIPHGKGENKYYHIFPSDLKVTWNVDNFFENYYLYRKTYLQAALYTEALKVWGKEKYENVIVEPVSFIVSDSFNYMNPLRYVLDSDDIEDSYKGFEYKGRKYKGLDQVIDDLSWAKTNDIWNMSRENYVNGGLSRLRK